MARDADHDDSGGVSAILNRIDPFAWVPIITMLVLALVTALVLEVPLLGLMLLIMALVIFGFDLWINSRKQAGKAPLVNPALLRHDARDSAPALR